MGAPHKLMGYEYSWRDLTCWAPRLQIRSFKNAQVFLVHFLFYFFLHGILIVFCFNFSSFSCSFLLLLSNSVKFLLLIQSFTLYLSLLIFYYLIFQKSFSYSLIPLSLLA